MADVYRRFRFIKPYTNKDGDTLPEGAELTILNDTIYYNDGMVTPVYYHMLRRLIDNCINGKEPNYLKEVPIPYNKV